MDHRPPDREQPPVRIDRRFHVPVLVALLGGGGEVLAPILDPLDRPSEPARRVGDCDVLGIDDEFGAEPAAEIGRADDDPVLVETQCRHQGAQRAVRRLAGQPDRQAVVERIGHGDDAAAFDREPEPLVLAERHGDPVRGGGKSGVDVAVADLVLRQQIVVEMAVRGRGPGRQRIAAVRHGGKGAVVDIDQRGGVLGCVSGLGDDRGHRFADMAHLFLRQNLAVENVTIGIARQRGDQTPGGEMRGEVGMGQHRRHARHGLCRLRVDAGDFGMRERAPDEAGVQHSGQVDVVDEAPCAAQQRRVLEPRDRLADQRAGQLPRPRSVTTRSNAARVSSLTWCSMPSASARATSSLTPMAWRKATTIW